MPVVLDKLYELLRTLAYLFRYATWQLRRRLSTDWVVNTRFGKFRILATDRVIGVILHATRAYDTEKLAGVAAFLKRERLIPDDDAAVMLDIGANNGVIGIQAIKMGIAKRAVAIEPEPVNFELLQSNIALNDLGSAVQSVQCAVALEETEVTFELDPDNTGDHRVRMPEAGDGRFDEQLRQVIKVRARPLDHILAGLHSKWAPDIQLCWMDIQGFEAFAIESGVSVFARGVPTVVEVWPYGIKRAGCSLERFVGVVLRHWTHYHQLDDPAFEAHPVTELPTLLASLGDAGPFTDLLLVRR